MEETYNEELLQNLKQQQEQKLKEEELRLKEEELKLKYAEVMLKKILNLNVDDIKELITYDKTIEMLIFDMRLQTFICVEDLKSN